ncbi:MAG: hypothetical protein ABW044_09285 [Cellvibrio sp.]
MEFQTLPLHDATLISINYEWQLKSVSIVGERYNSSIQKISPFKILFTNVTLLSIPHSEEWGDSASILELATLNASGYQIQMQSGDLITIQAGNFSFE